MREEKRKSSESSDGSKLPSMSALPASSFDQGRTLADNGRSSSVQKIKVDETKPKSGYNSQSLSTHSQSLSTHIVIPKSTHLPSVPSTKNKVKIDYKSQSRKVQVSDDSDIDDLDWIPSKVEFSNKFVAPTKATFSSNENDTDLIPSRVDFSSKENDADMISPTRRVDFSSKEDDADMIPSRVDFSSKGNDADMISPTRRVDFSSKKNDADMIPPRADFYSSDDDSDIIPAKVTFSKKL